MALPEFPRGALRFRTLVILFVAAAYLAPVVARGGSADPGAWALKPGFDLRLVTHYRQGGGENAAWPALGAHLSVELASAASPFAAGLFGDYEVATHRSETNVRTGGSWVRYRRGRWELSTVAAYYASRPVDGLWLHGSKLAFEVRRGHKVAVETLRAMDGSGPRSLQVLYDAEISDNVSLTLVIGLGPDRLQDLGVRSRFVWHLR